MISEANSVVRLRTIVAGGGTVRSLPYVLKLFLKSPYGSGGVYLRQG